MNIPPVSIEQDGPGIDLTDAAAGISIEMSDPVTLHQECEGGLWSSMHSHGDRGNEKRVSVAGTREEGDI